MPRDRLAAMQQQAYIEDGDDFAVQMQEAMDGPMQEFFQEIEELRGIIGHVEQDIQRVKQVQNDILSCPQVDQKAKQQLDDLMNDIKKKANSARTKLKKLEQANEQAEQTQQFSQAELRMRKTQQMTVSRKFVEIMTEYNKIQVDYRDESKKKIARQMEIAGSAVTDDELERMLEGGDGAMLMGHVKIEGNEDQLRQTINDIQNRHEMFLSLEKSITELHDMFLDIAQLIESQGEMVNRIDTHVESAVEYTTRATNDTKKALEYQSKARRKKIMMMICMLVAGGLGTYIGGKYLGFWGG
jgi:syntaxin 1A